MTRNSKGARERERQAGRGMIEYTGRVSLVFDPHEMLRKGQHTFATAVKGSTDLDLLWSVLVAALEGLGYAKDPRLLTGAIASVVNKLAPELRKVVVNHIVRGNNLYVSSVVEYHCKECKREDLEDDGQHPASIATGPLSVEAGEEAIACPGTAREVPTYVVHMGREFESLINLDDQERMKAADLGIWVPGMEEPPTA